MIGITAEIALVGIIDERRNRLSWSRAQFTKAIIDEWVARGCPAVSEPDRAMLALHGPSKRKAS